MNIDAAIRKFADFLDKSWPLVFPLLIEREYTSDEDSIGDWLQSNWELLVERKVLPIDEHLEIYAAGADYNSPSSRILDITSLPDFAVVVKNEPHIIDLLSGEKVNVSSLIFEELVGFENGFYTQKPPFKYVLVDDKNTKRVFSIESITFSLEKLNK